jgi:PEP-CTERM motif
MKYALVVLLLLAGLSQSATAAIVFSLSPNNSTINLGNAAIFNVSVRSTLAAGEQVDGLEGNVISSAGTFTAASVTLLLNNGAVDVSTPGQAFMSNFLNGGFNLSNNDTLFARLTLSTTGVAPGNYNIRFETGSLAANSPTLAALAVQDGGPINFTITAIPEPSSLMLVGAISGLVAIRRKRR